MNMDEDIAYFLEKFGQPTQRVRAEPEVIEKFRGKLPDQLLLYWRDLGFSGFMNGLFWITNPDDYESALEAWIGDTPAMEEDAFYVIARSGFGELLLWGEKTGYRYLIDAPDGWVIQKGGAQKHIAEGHADRSIRWFFAGRSLDSCDRKVAGESLFEAAIARDGPLDPDEVFAFEPALFLGGDKALDHIKKRNIFVHLDLLAQLADREILDQAGLARKAFG